MRTYLKILSYGRPYFWLGGLVLASLLAYTLFSAVSLMSVIPFLEILFTPEKIDLSVPSGEIDWMNTANIKEHIYYNLRLAIQQYDRTLVLLWFSGGLLTAIFLKSLTRYAAAYWVAPLEQGIIHHLRTRLFSHLTTLDLGFFARKKKGDLLGLFASDVQLVQEAVLGNLQALLREPITMLSLMGFMLIISWKLTLFVLVLLPATGFLINIIARSLKRKARQGQEALGSLLSVLDEFLSGIRVVKAFQKEAYETSRYESKNESYTRLNVAIRRRVELASPITELLSVMVICLIIIFAESMITPPGSTVRGQITGPEFITFVLLFSQFLSPIKTLSNGVSRVQKGIAAYERLEQLLEEKPQLVQAVHPVRKNSFDVALRFEGVHFKYGEHEVLRGIDFELKRGQVVALVGPSGAGKSTLADLVPRFYDPSEGRITVDGTELRDLLLEDLRSLMGVVTQEGVLFHDTVARNIAYGDLQPDREALIRAAKIAHAYDFIQEMPLGFDTEIGERGTMLSGGQRQRLAIARAVYRQAPILILDEATSNLDTQSEQLVQDALNHLLENSTALVIAHRLSTIQRADLILVMEEGKIVERGTHAELVQADGLYSKLYALQFQD